MNFFDALQNELVTKKTLTTNGAIAYEHAGKALLDFNFGLSAMRNMSPAEIVDEFIKVYAEDPKIAIKYLFYVGDIREGMGERKVFRSCLTYLAMIRPDVVNELLSLIPEYNRWDTLIQLIEVPSLKDRVTDIIRKQFILDLNGSFNNKPISLLAKWLPSENTSSKETRALAKTVREAIGVKPANYRKSLSKMRAHLNVVETKMSANKWSEIDYETVPSKANLNYMNAFLRHDKERRMEFLSAVTKGEAKINAKALQAHEIVNKYTDTRGWRSALKPLDTTLEELWKNLPDYGVENTLVVRDGSGSMTWGGFGSAKPLDVATALAIYMAQHNTGAWKNKYITFSADPKIVDISNCASLREALALSYKEADCSNTDIYKTMRLILDTAVKNGMTQEDMPASIVICSDMQFDGRSFNMNQSLFDHIAKEFADAGYKLPRICFWNINGALSKTVPMQSNELGLVLCSGFSVEILKMFMSGETDPYKILVEQLNSPRYDAIEEVLIDVL